ncbi:MULTISPECIES: hypothetical protein [Pseudomonas syringae group]|uniref:Prophage PssSM-02, Orf76 n=1 Tax=Pseudomonas syringae pv. ribicola TaxID=55398 RepID=A0A3M2VMM7_PSESI|nr:hypothetical protein [Pseudomonas syringae group genomosp. 3]RML40547.1 Prophage PssSM-02, Orf76 [Pseudomonas syringae pv. ribicola]
MNVDNAEDWPFCPTDEQMLKQHAHLVSEENRLLGDEVSQYRNHVAKLIDMHICAAKSPVRPAYLDVIGYSAIKNPLGGGFNQIFNVESLCSILTKRLVSLYVLFGTGIYHAESILPHLLHAAGNGSFVFFGDFPNFIYSL